MRLATRFRVKVVGPLTETLARLHQRHHGHRWHHPNRRAHHHAAHALLAFGLISVAAVVLVFLLVLVVPAEVGVIRTRVEAAIQQTLGPGYGVEVGKASMALDRVSGLVIEVADVAISDSEGRMVASIPSTTMSLDPAALLRLNAAVRTVEMRDAQVAFVRSANGVVHLGDPTSVVAGVSAASPQPQSASGGPVDAAPSAAPQGVVGPDTGGQGGFPDLVQALRILDRGIEPPISAAVRAGFERFSLIKSTISIWDAASDQQRSFRHADLAVTVDGEAGHVSVNLDVSGYSGRWTFIAERSLEPSGLGRNLSLVFSQVTLADIFPGVTSDDLPINSDIPLYGRATIRMSEFGEVEDANVRLDLGAGSIEIGRRGDSMRIDEATVKLRWDVANQILYVEPSTVFSGDTRGVWVGSIRPTGEGDQRRYAFELESRGGVLAPRDSGERPLPVQRIAVAGDYHPKDRLLTIENATLVSPVASFAAAGTLGFSGPTPSLAMAASFSPMPVWALKQMWPPLIAGGARSWVLSHVTDGKLTAGRYEAAIPPGILWNPDHPPIAEDAVRLQLRVEDVSFVPFGDLPAVQDASANLVLAGRTFGLDLDGGKIVTQSGEVINLDIGAFAIPLTGPLHPDAQLEAQLSGSAQAIAELANANPLKTLDRRQLAATGFSGSATASLSVRWPLQPDLTEADVDWNVSLALKDFASKQPLEGRAVEKGDLTAQFNRQEVEISGRAVIDGVPADVGIVQPLSGSTTGSTGGSQVRLSLDEAARKRLGIGMEEILGGVVTARVTSLPGAVKGQSYELDLTRARLTLAALGWSKGIGVPATATFDLVPDAKGYELRNLRLEGRGFGLAGSARLDSRYALQSADIERLSLRKGDQLRARVERHGNDYRITAVGDSFDARGVIDRIGNAAEPGNTDGNVTITAQIRRLVGFNRESIENANLSLSYAGGTPRLVDLTGRLGNADLTATYRDQRSGSQLDVRIADAGRFFRFVDLYTRMAGGHMSIQARGQGSGRDLVGNLDIVDFAIVNEPAMDRVAASGSGSQTGFNPSNVGFERLYANFTKRGSVLVIGDAVLRGMSIGATFGGTLDMGSSRLSLTGTYIPSYSFNNAFSRIPILGLALGGGLDEGLVGVTFKVDGPISSPQLFVNPLSAIAPGIFRKIFEFQ